MQGSMPEQRQGLELGGQNAGPKSRHSAGVAAGSQAKSVQGERVSLTDEGHARQDEGEVHKLQAAHCVCTGRCARVWGERGASVNVQCKRQAEAPPPSSQAAGASARRSTHTL